MKLKRGVRYTVLICLIIAAVTGCSKPAESTGNETAIEEKVKTEQKSTAMGRYVEQSVEMPELEEFETVISLNRIQEEMVLYTLNIQADNSRIYYTYRKTADENWVKKEAVWLNAALKGEKMRLRGIRTSGDSLYAWYFDGGYIPHILKTTDEIGAEEIKIQDFTNKENIPNGFAVTGKGEIAVSYMGGSMMNMVVLYEPETGNEIRRFSTSGSESDDNSNLMDAGDNKLIILSEDGKGFTVYDTDTGNVVDKISAEINQSSGMVDGLIAVGQENDYYHLSSVGLSHFQSGGSIMETIIDGKLNSIGLEGIWYRALLIGDAQDYTVLYRDENNYELAHFTYDSEVPTVPEVQLTLYGLRKDKAVARAIGTYQKENPDVQISYYTAQTDEGAVADADSIRTLNAELLNGKGADILLLDGLPLDSYIEKGVLEDISSVIQPMKSEGALLENIISGYEKGDGKIYAVPVRFSIPILLGDKETAEAQQSLDTLRRYAGTNAGKEIISYVFKTVTYDELAEYILLVNYGEITGNGMITDKNKLIEYLETVKETGDAAGATIKAEPKPPTTADELRSMGQVMRDDIVRFEFGNYPMEAGTVRGTEIKGVIDMMEPLGLKKDYAKEIVSVNNMYIPTGIIGINSASEQKEKAKDFIRCILSEAEQDRDLGGGMPINNKALENYCNKESEISMGASFTLNGKEVRLNFVWPEKEEIKEITDMARTLTAPLNMDRIYKETILSEAKLYFEGTVSAEKAAEAIIRKVSTYLAE